MLEFTSELGLQVKLPASPDGSQLSSAVRLELRGSGCFSVWGIVDSGESAPAWADPAFAVTLFGPGASNAPANCRVDRIAAGDGSIRYRAVGTTDCVAAALEVWQESGAFKWSLAISNPNTGSGKPLPLWSAELRFEEFAFGDEGEFWSALPYGGRTHPYGKLASLEEPGVDFAQGVIGLELPLVYLHDPGSHCGLELEFFLGERPVAWLRPGEVRGHAHWCVTWSTERLLLPGQTHSYSGSGAIRPYAGHPLDQMRLWRDSAEEKYSLVPPLAPEWARRANIVEFNMNPLYSGHAFKRLDDPLCRRQLEEWKELGYTAIFAVSHSRTGQNFLSMFDYEACPEVGGSEAEARMLEWAHELGFHIFLWVTTVGVDRDAAIVAEHPEWFGRRKNGEFFYAWDSHEHDGYTGYAPDADPLALGWRDWLKGQTIDLIGRGFDGIFVDGCIPRAANHARYFWPGEARNGVEEQVRDLAECVRAQGAGLITFVEDEGVMLQASCEMTNGRYAPLVPRLKGTGFDPGMGGGPQAAMAASSKTPPLITPEQTRDFLLARYASLLPGALSSDVLEGYHSEAVWPWVAQSLFAGAVPKTHSEWLQTPEIYRPQAELGEPPANEQLPDHRLQGHTRFLWLLKLRRDNPLIWNAPLSIEGVVVEGDAAVVGMLRPSPQGCLLALLQFAPRAATVRVTLAEPTDIPRAQRASAGQPQARAWRVREIMSPNGVLQSSAVGQVGDGHGLQLELDTYTVRIFECY